MKTLEKKVHFTAEGTSVDCYDSNGSPVKYMTVGGDPFIAIDSSIDRLLNIPCATVYNQELNYYKEQRADVFGHADLAGVVNGKFISMRHSVYNYALRSCTSRELASFYLAKYKAYKNAVKLEAVGPGFPEAERWKVQDAKEGRR